jgi:general secretion pathway protein L
MIFWPADAADDACGWARVIDGHVVLRGEGRDWRSTTRLVALPEDERALVVLPAGETALHWIACPGMTVRQGAAAAPLMAKEGSIGDVDALHAATLVAAEPEQPHVVAVIARDAMEAWLQWCEAHGVPDAALMPSPLILPEPDTGFLAAHIGTEDVLRGADCAMPALEPHAALIVGESPISVLSPAQVEKRLVSALLDTPLDLRQGSYARRGARALDPAWLKRIAMLAGGIAFASLVIALVTIIRLNIATASLNNSTLELARPLVPQAVDAADADSRLAAMVAARGGAGGFTGTAAAVATAIRGVNGVTMSSLSRMPDGSLRVQLAAPRAEDINTVLIALQNAGWRISANGVQQQGALMIADITVMPS